MTKRFGFTLAEVLITLGIIGVVAAMTMPTLMNQTNGAQYKAAYKKALSAISQGVTLNVALDGNSFADADSVGAIKDILKDRMNVVKGSDAAAKVGYSADPAGVTQLATNYSLFFNDGTTFSFAGPASGKTCTNTATVTANNNKCYGFIDVNGLKGPNKIVKCDDGNQQATNCTVTNPTDIYPVVFYDQTILPNSDAARAVLYGK